MSYFLAQPLSFIRCSATEDLIAAFLVAVVLISGSYSMNFNTQAGRCSFILVFKCLEVWLI